MELNAALDPTGCSSYDRMNRYSAPNGTGSECLAAETDDLASYIQVLYVY